MVKYWQMMKYVDLRQRVLELLVQCLKDVPVVRKLDCDLDQAGLSQELLLDVHTEQDTYRLIVEIRNSGQPRYARDAVAHLTVKSGKSPIKVCPVFAAPFISDTTADMCREAGAGYIDLVGNCRLAFDGIFIERQGQPNAFASKRSLRSLYQTRSSRVLRALFFDPNLKWKLLDLSEAAGVSLGQVFNVKEALVDREWAVFDKDGLRLVQPERVLRDWGAHYALQKEKLFNFHSAETPAELESRLAGRLSAEGIRYALTSFPAAARQCSAPRYNRVFAYVDSEIGRLAALLNLKPAESMPTVTLIAPYDVGVFYGMKEILGANTVSPIQTYLDLIALGGKGEEAAETLFRQVIKKTISLL
jgi:hypothetical protein